MSLRVWLPLDGNLRNLGCSYNEITLTTGNSWTSEGKIGQQALILTKLQTILPQISCMKGAKQLSYAYWVKVNTTWTANFLDGIRWYSINEEDGTIAYSRQEFYNNCTRIGTWFASDDTGINNISNCTFIPGQWIHLAGIFNYNTGEASFYINGILQKTVISLNTSHYCRGDFYIGDNGVDISMNDVRIYDHALSAAEVHEIAKGLVLHYKMDGPLNGINCNLGNYSQQLNGAAASSANSNWSKRGASSVILSEGIGKIHCSSTWQGVSIYANNLNLQIGSTYTISCYAYTNVDSGAHISFYPMMYNSSGTRDTTSKLPISIMGDFFVEANSRSFGTNSLLTTPTLYYASFIWNQTMQDIIDEGGHIELSIQVSGTYTEDREDILYLPKLETGLKATERIGSLFDLHLNPLLVSDSSGYNYNGTITDIVEYNPDSPIKYAETIYFPKNTSGIEIPNIPMNIFNEENTISFWIKPYNESGQRSIYCASYSGVSYSIEKHANNKLRIWWAGEPDCVASKLTIDDNVWQHIAVVKSVDKENLLLYKNGQYVETITNDFADKNWSGIYRIGRDYRDENIAYIGQMSDFRIYVTALSSSEIMELYNLGARIDKNKNIYSDEFIEQEIIEREKKFENQDIVSLYTPKETALKDLKINIEPVQDLHGYDHPWPPGDGKNLLDAQNVFCSSRVNSQHHFTDYITLPAGTYTLSFTISTNVTGVTNKPFYLAQPSVFCNEDFYTAGRHSWTFTISEETRLKFAWHGYTYADCTISDFMLELGSTATAYSPYSNICPILGFEGLTVTRTGKNLLNNVLTSRTSYGTTFTVNSDGSITVSGTPSAQVRVPICRGLAWDGRAYVTFSFGDMPTGTRVFARKFYNGVQNYPTINPTSNQPVGALIYDVYLEINTSFNGTAFTVYPQCELGSTATAYEPYQGATYSITFPTEAGTVYGGTLDATNGVLTVDRAMMNLTSDFSWSTWGVNYRTNGITGFYIYRHSMPSTLDFSNIGEAVLTNLLPINNSVWGGSAVGYMTNVRGNESSDWYETVCISNETASILSTDTNAEAIEKFKAFLELTPLNVLYELATPIEVNLTPQQIGTLLGQNNIWANTGSISINYNHLITRFTRQKQIIADDFIEIDNTASLQNGLVLSNQLIEL